MGHQETYLLRQSTIAKVAVLNGHPAGVKKDVPVRRKRTEEPSRPLKNQPVTSIVLPFAATNVINLM
jgi:hypothetical protein